MNVVSFKAVLKVCIIRVNFPKTFHNSAVLVTFSEKCDKILSQKVIL